MQMETVAIIIPAYKASFLRQTLESVAAQTCRDFRVYVGDDKSPEDLQTIVQAYADRIPLVYRRFDENLGGTDLVAHWERCIRLSEEPLVWLFSDDDLMPSDAVERILAAWNTRGSELFFARFPLSVVDADGHLKMSNPALTDRVISGYEFLLDKLSAGSVRLPASMFSAASCWMRQGALSTSRWPGARTMPRGPGWPTVRAACLRCRGRQSGGAMPTERTSATPPASIGRS